MSVTSKKFYCNGPLSEPDRALSFVPAEPSRFNRRSLKRAAAQTEAVDPLGWSVILRIILTHNIYMHMNETVTRYLFNNKLGPFCLLC